MSRAVTASTLLLALLALGCAQQEPTPSEDHTSATQTQAPLGPTHAIAVLTPAEGSEVRGTLLLEETPDGVRVTGQVTGLAPGSAHGFHIHEYGDMTATDGTSLGSHYNPGNAEHALPEQDVEKHKGDFGNITADDNGVAAIDKTFGGVKVQEVLGRGIVIHADPDDGSQPTGNAGGRIAFGIIGIANIGS